MILGINFFWFTQSSASLTPLPFCLDALVSHLMMLLSTPSIFSLYFILFTRVVVAIVVTAVIVIAY
jgi:hypothetical protein